MKRLLFYISLLWAQEMSSPVKRRLFLALVFAMVLAITFEAEAVAYCCRTGYPQWVCEMFWVC